jgi:hypothetical protein
VRIDNPPADLTHPNGYYGCNDRASLMMRVSNFPDEVLPLLQLETLTALSAVERYGCQSIVEFGCFDGRSLEVARLADVDYVGIDLNQSGIETLRQRISCEELDGRATAIVADALKPGEWVDKIPDGRALVHLPFNFVGGFRNVPELLRSVAVVPDMMLLITIFNTDAYTTSVRRRYYTACGVNSLKLTHGESGGVVFTGSADFFSHSPSPEALRKCLADCGIDVIAERANRVGRCFLAAPRDSMIAK